MAIPVLSVHGLGFCLFRLMGLMRKASTLFRLGSGGGVAGWGLKAPLVCLVGLPFEDLPYPRLPRPLPFVAQVGPDGIFSLSEI